MNLVKRLDQIRKNYKSRARYHSPFDLIRAIVEAVHTAHVWLPVLALLLILSSVFSIHIVTKDVELGWELYSGLALTGLLLLFRLLPSLLLKFRMPVAVAVFEQVSDFPKFEGAYCRFAEHGDVASVAAYANNILPYKYSSRVDLGKRQKTYYRWLECNPKVILLMFKIDEPDVLIGFSIVMRVTKQTYVDYRNGLIGLWDISVEQTVPSNSPDTPYLMTQLLHCSNEAGALSSALKTCAFFEHVLQFCPDVVGSPPVFFGARSSRRGKENAVRLGYEHSRMSEGGKEIYELDFRRVDELSSDARRTFRLLKEMPKTLDESLLIRRLREKTKMT